MSANVIVAEANALCWFCEQRPGSAAAVNNLMMYGNVARDHNGNFVWDRFIVEVPRCDACKSVHGLARSIPAIGSVLGVVLGVIVGIILFLLILSAGLLLISVSLFVIVIGGSAAVGRWAGSQISNAIHRARGVKANDRADEHPSVALMFARNCGVGARPPYAR